jgi:hypothetical protein
MKKLVPLLAGLAAVGILGLPGTLARAKTYKSYISATGTTNVNCTLATPCPTFQSAHDATAPGGEISCLDGGASFAVFPSLTITKSITIDCGNLPHAYFPLSIVINALGIVVKIRNLTINGTGSFSPGIDFQNGAELVLENCLIHLYSGVAIRFQPSTPDSQLSIINSNIENNGTAPSGGGGLQVIPSAGGSARIVLDNVKFRYNATAILLSSANGAIEMVMKDSTIRSSLSNGILSQAGTSINFVIDHSSLTNNVGSALQSLGANSNISIGDSTISGNDVGVSSVSGGVVESFKNNQIGGNGRDGTPLNAVSGFSGTMQ